MGRRKKTPMNVANICALLRARREELGISQRNMAKQLGFYQELRLRAKAQHQLMLDTAEAENGTFIKVCRG